MVRMMWVVGEVIASGSGKTVPSNERMREYLIMEHVLA